MKKGKQRTAGREFGKKRPKGGREHQKYAQETGQCGYNSGSAFSYSVAGQEKNEVKKDTPRSRGALVPSRVDSQQK